MDAAITSIARQAAASDSTLAASERVALAYFDRFLCRIFSEGSSSEWLLKGGMGMLARVPTARTTRDIDLYVADRSLDTAVEELRRLAGVDLHDHFRFVFLDRREALTGGHQPYVEGCTVRFEVYVGTTRKNVISVDLAVSTGVTGEVEVAVPASRLDLPRLESHPYRLYPVVDQIADKVCATMESHESGPSSRQKDLVDLVVLAVTHDIDGSALTRALIAETRRRLMSEVTEFVVPSNWGAPYTAMARKVPECENLTTVGAAAALVSDLVGPALSGDCHGQTWDHDRRQWR